MNNLPPLVSQIVAQAVPAAKEFVSTHHYGSIYCAAVASEAALCILYNLVAGSVNGVIGEDGTAVRNFKAIGAHLVNVAAFGFGAINPVAGVIMPLAMATLTKDDAPRSRELYSPNRYFVTQLVTGIPKKIFEGAVNQISHTLYLPPKVTYVAASVLTIFGALYAMNMSPLTSANFKAITDAVASIRFS